MSAENARFFPRARLDLLEQAAYLAENASIEVTERFLDAAEHSVAKLAEMPRIGRVWEGLRPETQGKIRGWRDTGIAVARVLHSARDLPPLLDGYL